MKTLTTFWMAAVLMLGAGGTAPAAPPGNAKPALWKLADADTVIYLFGTIHVLPKDHIWRTPSVEAAISASQALVIEVADSGDKDVVRAVFNELGTSPGLPPVTARIPAKKRPRLTKMIESLGMKPAQLTRFESWAVSLILVGAMMGDIGLEPQAGVEEQLSKIFSSSGKPISGLETTRAQLGFFDLLSEKAQRFLLASMTDSAAKQRHQFDAMISAWQRGDVKAISATFDKELQSSPELRAALLTERNRNWTQHLAKRLETPGTVFVAVGAGHLAGTQSVQSMLAARGLIVTRVQ